MGTRLYRSRDDRMLAGVAGGLAEMWDADPSLVRIVWALLVVLTGGIALVVYVVMALVAREGPGGWRAGAPAASAPPNASGSGPATTFSSPPPNAFSSPPPPDWRGQRAARRRRPPAARAGLR